FITTVLDPAPGEDTPETAIDVRALLAEAADTAGEGPVPVVDDWTAGRYGFGRQDRFAVLTGGAGALMCALNASRAAGAALVMPDEAATASPAALIGWLRDTPVTVLHLTGPQLRDLAAHDVRLPSLRRVFLDNDGRLTSHDVELVRRMAPSCRITALYRLDAAGRPLAAFDVPDDWSPRTAPLRVPLGTEVSGTRAELLNPAGLPVAPGEIGEIRAASRSTGDLGRRLPDGTLWFAGTAGTRNGQRDAVEDQRSPR